MGLEGSIEAELDSEKTGVREKTPKVPTSSKLASSEEEGPATLGCASASAGVCASVASCMSMLIIFRLIKC